MKTTNNTLKQIMFYKINKIFNFVFLKLEFLTNQIGPLKKRWRPIGLTQAGPDSLHIYWVDSTFTLETFMFIYSSCTLYNEYKLKNYKASVCLPQLSISNNSYCINNLVNLLKNMSKLELFAHCKATPYLNLIFYLLKIHYLIAMDSS